MLHARYGAATINLSKKRHAQDGTAVHPGGQLWMTGGREGSTVLKDNEVLQFPATFETSNGFDQKRWEWAHKKMRNKEVWTNSVPEAMKELPIALAGHCAVDINNQFVLFIGGGTTEFKADGTPVPNSGPVPTDHIHIYNFSSNKWQSTFLEDASLKKMRIGRMNHGCLKYEENGLIKIMVAGGITKTKAGQSIISNKVEVLDFNTKTWIFETDLPNFITGSKLILVGNRPTLIGRYGDEDQNKIIRYSSTKTWDSLPVTLLKGKSDFQILENNPSQVLVNPNMNSRNTKINPGSCATKHWRNLFGIIEEGKKVVYRTNAQNYPWIQLDLGMEMEVIKVRQFARYI